MPMPELLVTSLPAGVRGRTWTSRGGQLGPRVAIATALSVASALSSLGHAAPQAASQVAPDPAATATEAPEGRPSPDPLPLPLPQPQPQPLARRELGPPEPSPSGRGPAAGSLRGTQRNVHGLGVAGGAATGAGFAYRRYVGKGSVQGAVWAMVLDRGEDASVFGGLTYAHYLLVWHDDRRMSILPDTSALRLSVSGSYLFQRSTKTSTEFVQEDPLCVPSRNFPCKGLSSVAKRSSLDHTISLGVGIGFEFGAIMRPGLSVALDLQLTAMIDQAGLQRLWPLPTLAVMYSW